MNTKKRNIGARLGAMLLSLCLMMGLLPTTAFAQDTGTTIFGYEGSGNTWSMASVSAEDQSDYTALTSYDSFDWFYGLEMIGDTIYGVYSSYYNSSYDSELVILNPDLTIQETVGGWLNSSLDIEQIIDTTVQNDTLWGTYNTAEYEYSLEGGELVSIFKSGTSYLIPIDLTTGMADKTQIHQVTGLPGREIIYTIACNESGQMYAIVADGGENGGAATLYTIDTSSFEATRRDHQLRLQQYLCTGRHPLLGREQCRKALYRKYRHRKSDSRVRRHHRRLGAVAQCHDDSKRHCHDSLCQFRCQRRRYCHYGWPRGQWVAEGYAGG